MGHDHDTRRNRRALSRPGLLLLPALLALLPVPMVMVKAEQESARSTEETRADEPANNPLPNAAAAEPFDRFWPHGEFAGIALRDDRETVLERWGEPRDTSTLWAGRIRIDNYMPDRVLLYHDDQLVRIRIGMVGPFETRFDNGFDADVTRKQVVAALGPPKTPTSSMNRLIYRNGDRVLKIILDEEHPAIQVSGEGPRLGNPNPTSPHGARMQLPQGELSYERFSRNGAVGPIALGDPMADVVASVGEPGDVRSVHGGLKWTHYYDNGSLGYHEGRLTSITLRLYGDAGFSFDNGLTGKTTIEQAKAILGPDAAAIRSSGPRGRISFIGDRYIVSAYFMREGRYYPDNEEEERVAPLTKLTVHRRPRITSSQRPPDKKRR